MLSKTTPGLIAAGIIVMASTTLAQPKLTITPAQFDFGYAPQNSKISHTFALTNCNRLPRCTLTAW